MCKNKTHICKDEECKSCYIRSMAAHPRSEFWSIKNELPPRYVGQKSIYIFAFDCAECGHEFTMAPTNITTKGCWCPYCVHHKLCADEECDSCYQASCAAHECSLTWSSKNVLTPRQVIRGTSTKYIFDCDVCGHDYTSVPSTKHGCPYCAHLKLCPSEDCDFCYNNSFASEAASSFWCLTNAANPRQLFRTSHKKYNFICENGHAFTTTLNTISNKKTWCPFCKNKTEGKLAKWLRKRYSGVIHGHSFDWCTSPDCGKRLPFDFYIETLDTIVELDGRHHVEQVANWDCERAWFMDEHKNRCAIVNGKRLIRIFQPDVYHDLNNWEAKLETLMEHDFEPELINAYGDIPVHISYHT